MELRDKRELWGGFGDGLARAFELAVTPTIFAGLGYALDRWLGTVPVFTIVLLIFALIGYFVRMWYGYDAQMKVHEQSGPWAKSPPAAEREHEVPA